VGLFTWCFCRSCGLFVGSSLFVVYFALVCCLLVSMFGFGFVVLIVLACLFVLLLLI